MRDGASGTDRVGCGIGWQRGFCVHLEEKQWPPGTKQHGSQSSLWSHGPHEGKSMTLAGPGREGQGVGVGDTNKGTWGAIYFLENREPGESSGFKSWKEGHRTKGLGGGEGGHRIQEGLFQGEKR